jgi:glucose-1-phosphate thymidylyltransferase
MIAIVLAGGYAKRLWPLTLDKPKALLPIAGKPMIDYVAEKVVSLNPPMSKIVLSTNLRFQPQFQAWLEAKGYRGIELVPDDSLREEEKPGAIRAIANIVSTTGEEDVLVLAGDNLFTDDLADFLRFFDEKRVSTIALYHARSLEEVGRGATVTLDEAGRVLEFVEKPLYPKTTLVGACVYAFPEGIGARLKEYLELGLPTDEPGRFIEWLHKREPVYGCMLQDYLWDIGTLESYRAADEFFSKCSSGHLS